VEATEDDLKKLLKRLDPDPEAAWEKYRTIWQKLVTFFQHHNCPSASDHAQDALSRIARRDDLEEIRDVGAFAYGVASKMRFEIYEKLKREISIEDPAGAIGDRESSNVVDPIEEIDRQRKLTCFTRCLRRLTADERKLFLNFQLADSKIRSEERNKLAMLAGISVGALRVRVCRTRREVEQCARKCLINRDKSLL
jgi:DNA-directed RNA polymerase specialized sigma24 family protein